MFVTNGVDDIGGGSAESVGYPMAVVFYCMHG
jgi:hypothetical protein